MTDAVLAPAPEEIPVFFPAGGETLFGILTRPAAQPKGVGVILLAVRATFHRNRVAVLLARRLAGLGFHVLRFDYHGLADSTGTATFHLDQPFVDDVEGAVRRMREEGVEEFVLVGQCFGARTALAAAARLDGMAGAVLVALPVLDWSGKTAQKLGARQLARRGIRPSSLRALRNRERRRAYLRLVLAKGRMLRGRPRKAENPASLVSPVVLRPLEQLVKGRVPVVFLYGTQDGYYQDFRQALQGRIGDLFRHHPDLLHLSDEIEGQVHGYRELSVQEPFLEVAEDWIGRITETEQRGQTDGL